MFNFSLGCSSFLKIFGSGAVAKTPLVNKNNPGAIHIGQNLWSYSEFFICIPKPTAE